MKHLENNKFGFLTVLKNTGNNGKERIWLCKCECGKKIILTTYKLTSGNTRSCGCQSNYLKRISKLGKNNPRWQGDKVSKDGVHLWLKRTFKRERICDLCNSTKEKRYDWALKAGCKYQRRRANFLRLCRRCHVKYDYLHGMRGHKEWKNN